MSSTSRPFVEVRGPTSSINRKPTKEELKVAKELRSKLTALKKKKAKIVAEIQLLEKSCTHTVSVDSAGWPYDSRSCYSCGESQGLI